jgi:lipopolysaccharide export system protein LptC
MSEATRSGAPRREGPPAARAEPDPAAEGRGPMRLAFTTLRRAPNLRRLSRRRRRVRLAKFVLPTVALALLTALAAWPQLAGEGGAARLDFRAITDVVHGDTVYGARYRGVDRENRPYTVTAEVARRVTPDRINLREPQGDLQLGPGSSVILEARRGVFRQAEHALDLSRDVTLYRNDGTTVMTESAAIDLRRGAAAGSAPVQATGPFGTLTAQGGFTLLDKGADIQFFGPARVVLSGATN